MCSFSFCAAHLLIHKTMSCAISNGRSIIQLITLKNTRTSPRFMYQSLNRLSLERNVITDINVYSTTQRSLLSPKFGTLCSAGLPLSKKFSQNCNEFDYHKVCDETLDSLCEYFEDLVENSAHLTAADVTYGDGVLTVNFGAPHGVYVINRQTPNKQIWLSSPTSGPRRYDFESSKKAWIYRHTQESLHQLLQSEISKIVRQEVNFYQCAFSGQD